MKRGALCLLTIGMFGQFFWLTLADNIERQAIAWNIGQSVQMLALLIVVAWLSRSWTMASVCLLLGCFSVMVIWCETLWIVAPWPEIAGEGRCATRLNVPIFLLQMAAGLVVLAEVLRGK